MAKFIKTSLYLINTLNIILIALLFVFAIRTIAINYIKISEINKEVKEEHYNIIDKYRKLLIFLLRNNLPTNLLYINAASTAAYKMPPAQNFNIFDSKDIKPINNTSITNNADDSITGCYSGRCLNIIVEKKKLLAHLLNGKFLYYFELKQLPASKFATLKLSTNKLITDNPLLGLILLYFTIFYFFRSLWLFFNNRQLTTINYRIKSELEKKEVALANQVINNDKLYRSIAITCELLDEYFTHYINKILTENIFIEEISLKDILQQLEDYCSGQLVRQGLKLTLEINSNDDICVKSDRRILFIILLNYMYRSVTRAKIASEIKIIVKQDENILYVNLEDIGYEYIPRINSASNKIYLCELPKPILEKLYTKLGVKVSEERVNDNNKTSINIMKRINDGSKNCKIINLKSYVSHN